LKSTSFNICLNLEHNEGLGSDSVAEDAVKAEGIKFVGEQPLVTEGILHALSHQIYYLPQAFCMGIEYLRSLGVVHGDVKPSNLFVCKRNGTTPIFIDFGFAHVIGSERVAQLLGYTAGYTSPEALKSRTITFADDIHCAGVAIMSMACQAHLKENEYRLNDAWQDFNPDRAPLGNTDKRIGA
jgi:serine/threonine protein kinase